MLRLSITSTAGHHSIVLPDPLKNLRILHPITQSVPLAQTPRGKIQKALKETSRHHRPDRKITTSWRALVKGRALRSPSSLFLRILIYGVTRQIDFD
ncbi:hypothetical protein AFLA_001978 [Aspergillus flavus NRRL3357]|nr:hypothetical protein AFLA_001978 [Aspergillus flavus NRRL3357]